MNKFLLILFLISTSVSYAQITLSKNEIHWSPDGKKILLLLWVKPQVKQLEQNVNDDNEIFVMDEDGNNLTRLTYIGVDVFDPSFSPDGKQILFTSYITGVNQIYIMNSDGTFQTNISNSTTDEFDPVWSPKGDKIAFQSTRDKTAQIYIMNPDGSDVKRVGNLEYNNSKPVWSPDGTKIACQTIRLPDFFENSLIDVKEDLSTFININEDTKNTFQADAFTNDGQKILFHQTYQKLFLSNANDLARNLSIYLHDIASNTNSIIAKNLDNVTVIGFTKNSDSIILSENSTLYVVDLNTKNKHRIFANTAYADYSATNNHIALISGSDIYTIKLDGSDKVKLTKK